MVGFIGKIGKVQFASLGDGENPPTPPDPPSGGVTFYDHAAVIGMPMADDSTGYTMGNGYEVAKGGYTDRVFVYKPEDANQTFRRCAFYSAAGVLLAQGTRGDMTPEPAGPAWIPVSLDEPLVFDALDQLIPSVTVNIGYASEAGAFTNPVVSGDITALGTGDISGGNGRFNDSSPTVLNFPNTSVGAASYFTDAMFFFDQDPPSLIPQGFPTAASTGATGTLAPYGGPLEITVDDTVIENMVVTGALLISASNVIIRNCEINYTDAYGVDGEFGPNLTVDDCTITGPGVLGGSNAGILGSGTFTGNKISESENGIVLGAGASTVTGNFIYRLRNNSGDPHVDGISIQGGQDGVLVQGNTVLASDTSCIFLKGDFGLIQNVVINANFCRQDPETAPAPAYTIYAEAGTGGIDGATVSITNNLLVRGNGGYYTSDVPGITVTGNVNAYSRIPV